MTTADVRLSALITNPAIDTTLPALSSCWLPGCESVPEMLLKTPELWSVASESAGRTRWLAMAWTFDAPAF